MDGWFRGCGGTLVVWAGVVGDVATTLNAVAFAVAVSCFSPGCRYTPSVCLLACWSSSSRILESSSWSAPLSVVVV